MATTGRRLRTTTWPPHPNVTIEIEQIETNDLQRTRVPAALQSGDAPDIFQAWGGGEMVQQVEAGYLMNLSDADPRHDRGNGWRWRPVDG